MKSPGLSPESLPTRHGTGQDSVRRSSPSSDTAPNVPSVAERPPHDEYSTDAVQAGPVSFSHRWPIFALVVLFVLAILWILPQWQLGSLNLQLRERIMLENSLRDTWAKIVATAFLLISAYFLWRYVEAVGKTVAAAERTVAAAEKNAAISQERHITERFVRVMELLGDEKLEVRLGGIYALERIARDSPADQSAVSEVLATYVREHAPWREGQNLPQRVRADVQAILTVLGRRSWAEHEEQPLDLHETALATAYLPFAKLQRAFLYEANLRGAMLYKANLRGAWLWKAHLHNAILEGAYLEGADLTAAEGLTWDQLNLAHIDKATKLPDYLRASAPDSLPRMSQIGVSTPRPASPEDASTAEKPVNNNEGLPTKVG